MVASRESGPAAGCLFRIPLPAGRSLAESATSPTSLRKRAPTTPNMKTGLFHDPNGRALDIDIAPSESVRNLSPDPHVPSRRARRSSGMECSSVPQDDRRRPWGEQLAPGVNGSGGRPANSPPRDLAENRPHPRGGLHGHVP